MARLCFAALIIVACAGCGAPAVPPLIQVLTGDAEESAKAEAINALKYMGPPAKEALPTLEELSKGKNTQLAARAAEAARTIGAGAR